MKTFQSNYQKRALLLSMFLVVGAIAFVLSHSFVMKNEPIRIGLATTLTGRASTSGVQSRNAIILAVEQINQAGGINGRLVELIIKDDKSDIEEAVRVNQELIDAGVVAILGHSLSTLSVEIVPIMNQKNMLLISFGSSTDELEGIDDNFIRVTVPDNRRTLAIADFAINIHNSRKMAVVYDFSNLKYSGAFYKNFKKEFENMGGQIISAVTFDPRIEFSASEIAEEIMDSSADGLLLITNSIHGALICQHLRNSGSTIRIVASQWTFRSSDFVNNGGRAAEGVVSVMEFNGDNSSENSVRFRSEYESRFGDTVGFASQMGYEAAQILFSALSETYDSARLKEVILEQKVFSGIDGEIIIDEYGDPIRTLYISEIQNGRVKTIGMIESSKPKD